LFPDQQKLGGFAKAYQKYTDPEFLAPKVNEEKRDGPPATFASLLRNCKLMQVRSADDR
jgi:hypothetical protein